MTFLLQAAAVALLLIMASGLTMIFFLKNRSEKIMVTQFLATVAVGWLLVTGQLTGKPYLFDVALLFALLAALTTVAFVQLGNGTKEDTGDGDHF